MSEPPDLVGRTIGARYRIEALVGGGAMGSVYRARHVGLGTDIAVKIMRPSIAEQPKFKERFYREAKAASLLDHPCSVRVLDFGEEADGLVYLAMEFLHGRDLLAILREEWPLTDERIVELLSQTLSAVAVAHSRGIVHRDLKPENIMVVPEDGESGERVKVCDFGIAKLSDARAFKSAEEVTTALTAGNSLLGTPEYMSPEQAQGEELDARSDLYSIGVVLYQMLVGKLPFSAENAIGLAVKHITEEPIPPSRRNPRVHPRLEAVCLRALRKERAERHATAKEMRAELRNAIGVGASASSRNPTSPTRDGAASAPTLGDGFAARRASPEERAPTMALEAERPAPPGLSGSDGSPTGSIGVPLESPQRGIILAVIGAALVATIAVLFWPRADSGHGLRAGAVIPSAIASTSAPVTEPSPAASGSSARTGGLAPPAAPVRDARPGRIAARTSAPALPIPSSKGASPGPSAVASTAPPAPSPPSSGGSEYKPARALVGLGSLTADRVRREEVEKKIAGLMPRMNECYRDALFMVGAPVGGTAELLLSIDGTGRIVTVVTAAQLPPFQRCASRLVAALSVPASAVDPGGGTAQQILTLTP